MQPAGSSQSDRQDRVGGPGESRRLPRGAQAVVMARVYFLAFSLAGPEPSFTARLATTSDEASATEATAALSAAMGETVASHAEHRALLVCGFGTVDQSLDRCVVVTVDRRLLTGPHLRVGPHTSEA
jgi:hypothetical protein